MISRDFIRMAVLTLLGPAIILAFFLKSITDVEKTCGFNILKKINRNKNDFILYERSCGATTEMEVHLSVVGSHEEFSGENGNLFSASIQPTNLMINKNIFLSIDDSGNITISTSNVALGHIFNQAPSVIFQQTSSSQ